MGATDTSGAIVDDRDLRIDIIRGAVMFALVVSHIEIVSALNLIVWERVGFVSGGEGFVILAGVVTGMVYGGRIRKVGFSQGAQGLIDRALQIYRVNVFIIASIAVLQWVSIADVTEVVSFTDRGAGISYPLFTAIDAPLRYHIADILLLRSGPQQAQILGLYVVLLGVSPLVLWLMHARRTGTALLISWLAYVAFWAFDTRVSSMQFEQAFPVLAWQVLFVSGMAVGFHRQAVMAFMATARGKAVLVLAFIVTTALLVLAQSTPNAFLPWWSRLPLIGPEDFNAMRLEWFAKDTLRPGRIVNYGAVLIVGYAILTRYWRMFERRLGWFFIPLGQHSLYVFIVHVYVVLLVSNVVPFGFTVPPSHMLVNTIVHLVALSVLWLMVRYQVLFGWIPR